MLKNPFVVIEFRDSLLRSRYKSRHAMLLPINGCSLELCILQLGTFSVYTMTPEWNEIFTRIEKRNDFYGNEISSRYHKNNYREI